MTRREFLKGAGAFLLLCASGWRGLEKAFSPDAKAAEGPLLREELRVARTFGGAEVYHNGELLFTVNEAGRELLALADGKNALDTIVKKTGAASAIETALFFVTLGEAGYLQNRVEVCLYET